MLRGALFTSIMRCGPRSRWSRVLVRCRRSRVRVAIHIRARCRVDVRAGGVCVHPVRVDYSICVDGFIRVAVRISVDVVVRVLWLRFLRLVRVCVGVGVCGRVGVAVLDRLVGCYVLGCLAFLDDATDVHRDGLPGFDDLTSARQLEQNDVGI